MRATVGRLKMRQTFERKAFCGTKSEYLVVEKKFGHTDFARHVVDIKFDVE